ncbi:MAG TPA: rod shape-determining protein MreD [Alphaproteobacteria bacterium]|nr:rod shape-determining protein MreD [Alphaproteobacteria bacterium]
MLQRLDRIGRALAPGAVTAMMALIAMLPLPYAGAVMPFFTLVAVFYWSVYRPDLLPMPAVFVIGLFQDLLGGGPVGLNALVLMGAQALVISQRLFFLAHPFVLLWWGFGVVAVAVAMAQWAMMAMVTGTAVPFAPIAVRIVLTVALFPALAWFLSRVQRAFLS